MAALYLTFRGGIAPSLKYKPHSASSHHQVRSPTPFWLKSIFDPGVVYIFVISKAGMKSNANKKVKSNINFLQRKGKE